MVGKTIKFLDDPTVKRHKLPSMGIDPIGLDYCRVEDIISLIGPQLAVPHRHDYYEIIWFTGGGGSHMVEFTNYALRPGMLFFFPRNQIHAFLTMDGIRGHMLRFGESFLKKLPESDAAAMKYSLFRIHSSPIRQLPEEKVSVLGTLMTLIKEEIAKKQKPHHPEMLRALLNAFLIESERLLPAPNPLVGIDKNTLNKFHHFSALLDDCFQRHYTVREYAEIMQVTPKTLRAACRRVSGLTVKQIIQERVVLEAKLYLRNTDLDVQEVAYRLGFEDPAYFSRFFKTATRISPSFFRMKKDGKVPE